MASVSAAARKVRPRLRPVLVVDAATALLGELLTVTTQSANVTTRWSGAVSDPQWPQVDLGGTQTPTAGGNERYLRGYGTARTTVYGYSLFTLAVHTVGNVVGPIPTPTPTPTPPGSAARPWVSSTAPVADPVTQLPAQMTLDQKISILPGNVTSPPYIGALTGIPALCEPSLGLQDGPVGAGDGLGGGTQLPAATAPTATVDTALEQQYGAVAGNEFAGKGVNVALGPTPNIVRDPRWGRAFETYSEDTYLSGQMAVANISSIKSLRQREVRVTVT